MSENPYERMMPPGPFVKAVDNAIAERNKATIPNVDAWRTRSLIDDVTEILAADGWVKSWPNSNAPMSDEYGNIAHLSNPTIDDFCVEFEYALGGVVESVHMDPMHGAGRIARVISALSSAPED